MNFKNARKYFQLVGFCIAVLAVTLVFGLEFGFLPQNFASSALDILIVLLGLCIAGSYFSKNK